LLRQRFEILGEQFTSIHGGVDFVALDRETLVFVELRSRGSEKDRRGRQDRELEASEVRQIIDAWLEAQPEDAVRKVRFDVLRLDWYVDRNAKPVIRYFPSAVDLEDNTTPIEPTHA
jgi:Holliday junction resolvase-like predicted endonuclease